MLKVARSAPSVVLLILSLFSAAGCRKAQTRSPAPPVSAAPDSATNPSTSAAVAAALNPAPAPGTHTLYVEPDAGFSWLYALVNNAQHTLDMTMYELVDPTFSADVVSACGRGVRVRVILDQSLEKASNTAAYTQINSAGPNCTAAWSNLQFQATHQKSLVVDNTVAAILTLNLASRDYTSTRDLALVENDANDIKAIETTFNTDYNSSTDLGYHPAGGDDLIWSPTTSQLALLNIIGSAKKTLLVENEEMGSSAIVEALEADCKRGVAVHIAMTDTSPSYHANYTALEAAGCGVHIGPDNPNTLYIHAKTMVADLGTPGQVGYLGSINFSNASLNSNRELGLYLYDAGILNQLSSTVAADYNRFPAFP